MKKYKNKYRITSTRLQNWDYGSNGAYFITICTKNRKHYFGKVKNKEMQLTEIGKLAETYWAEIPKHFPFITLGNFVIMPDHMHGILIIDKPTSQAKTLHCNVSPVSSISPVSTISPAHTTSPVSSISTKNQQIAKTRLIASQKGGITGNKNPMLHKNIARVIRWYKGRCTFEIRKINPAFGWQSLFHDHIIRNSKAFDKIQNYIANNPANWDK